ncbi:helix-turn-helix transcriptional regulator [Streptomyces sp. NPDC046887]|uniref:helix-turn-helix transcriptional regulator n=1 Tax=Streptomyces sp. NPDC046887 TaxID=3155472 RepID=UPI0033F3BE88
MDNPDGDALSARPRLPEEARRLYCLLVEHLDGVRADEVRGRAAFPPGSLTHAVDTLLALNLLCRASLREGMLRAVPPDSARVQLVGPIQRELDRRQREVDAVREVYSDLLHVYENAELHKNRSSPLEILRDVDAVRRTITELAAAATEEVITSQPGGARSEEVLKESLERTDDLLARGVRLRTIYHHTARFSPVTVDFVDHVTRRGAEVRTRSDGFMRLLLFDGEVAVTALRNDPLGAVVVRDPHVVSFMQTAFERAWSRATTFRPEYDPVTVECVLDEVKTTIAHLLAQGLEDKVIARRLGMSLRSYQRHLSEIMRRLGSKNRLHLGYLLHYHGVLERGMVPRSSAPCGGGPDDSPERER